MKRAVIAALTILVVSCLTATVQAQNPHFIKGPTVSLDSTTGDLCCSFKEAGLGNTPITYSLTAGTETFTFQCFTKSNNQPQGDPNGVSFSDQSNFVTLQPRNGQITGSVCLSPEKGGAGCQGQGLVLKLLAVDYENIRFCDVTDNICVNLGDQSETLPKPIKF